MQKNILVLVFGLLFAGQALANGCPDLSGEFANPDGTDAMQVTFKEIDGIPRYQIAQTEVVADGVQRVTEDTPTLHKEVRAFCGNDALYIHMVVIASSKGAAPLKMDAYFREKLDANGNLERTQLGSVVDVSSNKTTPMDATYIFIRQ